MAKKTKTVDKSDSSANLWLAADKLRNNMDAAEYKHVVLGLILLIVESAKLEQAIKANLKGLGYGG